jgi:lipoprotein-releasing system permease protein
VNLPLFIARRYFLSRKKTNFINIIVLISMLGICVGTASLVIVLSVFNGMEDLFRSLYSTFSSEVQVKATQGKTFRVNRELLGKIKNVPGVNFVAEVLEDNAVLLYRDAQMVVKVRGTTESLLKANGLEQKMIEGKLILQEDSLEYALLGAGVQYRLSIPLNDNFRPMELIYPKNRRKINLTSPDALNRLLIRPSGIFAIEQTYDNDYIFVSLPFAKDLFEAGDKRTFLEIKTLPNADIGKIQNDLKTVLGEKFAVLNRDEQNSGILRAIRFEKFFVYLTLSFIIAISSFNIFFSLTMLAIEKRKDISVLFAMGASEGFVKRIFFSEGALVAFAGASTGLVLGLSICIAQQLTGFVSMGMETAVVNAYPVRIHWQDLVAVVVTLVSITLLASFFPAQRAAKSAEKL